MKSIIRSILINSVTIALLAIILPSVSYGHSLYTLVICAVCLGIVNTFIKPIINLILLPINLISLGIAGWFVNAILLFLVTIFVPKFEIVPFNFYFLDQVIKFNLFWSYLLTATGLNFISNLVRSVVEKE